MQRKQLVKRNGKWTEEYIDLGPSKAVTMAFRALDGKRSSSRMIGANKRGTK